MWTVPREYQCARTYRYRKAILYSICVGVGIAIFNTSIIHSVLGGMITGLITWWRYSKEVERCHRIYTPGGK